MLTVVVSTYSRASFSVGLSRRQSLKRFTENVRVPGERVPNDYLWLMRKKLSATIPAIKVNLERLGFTFN